jgi:DNA polymerase epsilon subunit 2
VFQSQLSVRIREELPDLNFFFLSDVWLDHPRTLPGLQKIFENCVENHFVPKLIVLCGNFTSRSISHGQGRDVQRYQGSRVFLPISFLDLPWLENFDALADLIASYPMITRSTHFVFVPGPLDMTMNSTLPRRPLLSSFVGRLKAKIPKVHFATNPCRIKFFDQEIVIFRDDSMARMLRNIVGVKPDARSDDLKKFVRAASLNPFIASLQIYSWCNLFWTKGISAH